MTDNNGIHSGSLQFYPRVRAKKVIPSVNWKPVSKEGIGFMGFVGYKVGMISVLVKDETEHSMTKNKKIVVPATVIECPKMKIYSVRFYKNGKVMKDVVVSNDKILKKSVKISKKVGELKDFDDFDDVRVIMYTDVKNTCVDKNKADMIEIAVSGSVDGKLAFIKENVGKDISVGDVFSLRDDSGDPVNDVVDVRGVTKGFGTCGPMKRFGIALKSHKSEKGRRRPGSLAPWHPARVTFRAPQAGQHGYFSRITYNNLILAVGNISENDINPKGGFEHYGVIKNDYIILKGSIPGPQKRGIMITAAIRPTKSVVKKKLEVLGLR